MGERLVKKRKLASTALAAVMGLSTLTMGAFTPTANAEVVKKAETALEEVKHSHKGGPFDLAIANDERLIEMLKKEGKIDKNADPEEEREVLQKYLEEKQKLASAQPEGELTEEVKDKHKKIKDEHDDDEMDDDKKKKHKHHRGLEPVKEEKWTGNQRVDNVLVLLIKYPDFAPTDINPEDTDMFYEQYPKEHYYDMIFGEKGYEGPNGENLISVKQYYEKQSGGSYSIDGAVGGWYEAKHPAAYYGGNDPAPDGSDKNARGLVKEALTAAAQDPNLDLSNFDQEDRYDFDGDGNFREPDGMVDHLMVVHSSVGEEAGGGSLGGDAIWSHRWNLGNVFAIPGTETDVPYWDGAMSAYDYTIEPADGAAGVFAHEYGHDLELPDEYDTQYSGQGEPVAYWSIMSSGSWAGKVPGTEPTGFSPWAKEFLQSYVGGNWLTGSTFNLEDIDEDGKELLLDQANTKGTNNDAVRINLPDKATVVNTPFSGQYEYFSGKGNDLNNSMVTSLDLSNATAAELSFKTWYEIEKDWDYASVQVKESGSEEWVTVQGNITTDTNPNKQNPGYGITGSSNGKWVDGSFNLSAYAGKKIELKLNYWTDVAATMPGFYVDDVSVTVDGTQVLVDDAEAQSKFTLEGFTKDEGKFFSEHYYLLEWRNHAGVDKGLAHIKRGDSLMSYDEGLLVWYVDDSYDNNWTGTHPGDGFLGVVDADQRTLEWSDGTVAATRYQIHDAAFNHKRGDRMFLDYSDINGLTLKDRHVRSIEEFKDSRDYSNEGIPDAGRNILEYGLEVEVEKTSRDQSVAQIEISREDHSDDDREDDDDEDRDEGEEDED
nr:immune inhibitor A domain-containing protein [Bacillus pakistanensis]